MPQGGVLEQAAQFWALTLTHALVMFPYVTLPPFAISPLLQAFGRAAARRRLVERPAAFWRAVWLGICSPPGRGKIFAEARSLLGAGVSPFAVVTFIVAAHSLLVYFAFLIAALNGPQPVLGLAFGALLSAAILKALLARIPAEAWTPARERAAATPVAQSGAGNPGRARAVAKALLGDLASVSWPLVLGSGLGALVAAWGLSESFFSIQGSHGALAQALNAGAGLLLASVSGVPPVGNVYLAAWLWKAEFFTYAGLMAFYLGVLITPFAIPRYTGLFGRALGWKVVRSVAAAVVISALAVTACWYGLDWSLHLVGLGEPIEALIDSTVRPNPVPWFHTLFWAPAGHAH